MDISSPFDAALDALLQAWKQRDDLRQQGCVDDRQIRRAFVELDRARVWVAQADRGRI